MAARAVVLSPTLVKRKQPVAVARKVSLIEVCRRTFLARKRVRVAVQWTFDHDSRPHFSLHLAMERRKINDFPLGKRPS